MHDHLYPCRRHGPLLQDFFLFREISIGIGAPCRHEYLTNRPETRPSPDQYPLRLLMYIKVMRLQQPPCHGT